MATERRRSTRIDLAAVQGGRQEVLDAQLRGRPVDPDADVLLKEVLEERKLGRTRGPYASPAS